MLAILFAFLLQNLYSKLCVDLSDTENDDVVQKKCKDNSDNQKYECDVVTRSFKRRRSSMCVTTGNELVFNSACRAGWSERHLKGRPTFSHSSGGGTTILNQLAEMIYLIFIYIQRDGAQSCQTLTNLLTWFGGRLWPNNEEVLVCVSTPIPFNRESGNQFINRFHKTVASLILKPG